MIAMLYFNGSSWAKEDLILTFLLNDLEESVPIRDINRVHGTRFIIWYILKISIPNLVYFNVHEPFS